MLGGGAGTSVMHSAGARAYSRRFVAAVIAIALSPEAIAESHRVKSLERLTDGIFPVWSPDGNEIAFTRQENDTFEVYVMRPDGGGERCLTCGKTDLRRTGYRGQPYYHPSGEYLVFVAESAKLRRKGNGIVERPGVGRNNNVWIMNREATRFWRLTDYAENWGVIRPSFSHDGRKICWNEEFSMEKYPDGHGWGWSDVLNRKGEELGAWRMKHADVEFGRDGEPRLSNIRAVDPPEGFTLLEGSGFTRDDRRLIFSYADLSESPGGRGFRGDIYTSDLEGANLERLTRTPAQHDENATFSPDGKTIAWAHPPGTGRKGMPGAGEELYLMNADGSGEKRLTFFSDPKSDHYDRHSRQMSEVHWSPDGKRLVLGHASRRNRRDRIIGSSVWVLTLDEASDVTDPPRRRWTDAPGSIRISR
jgi:Tol biopolymer transport system component